MAFVADYPSLENIACPWSGRKNDATSRSRFPEIAISSTTHLANCLKNHFDHQATAHD
jgi:hypothetical protein